ncbi:uncharacterized protein PG986_012443 [Apiospora aurea]|uniref:feruloyl esterase n=1 Tax=Apiospora aurea TaxID=335848 RepID=A0ABR1Q005_9PEZI
MYGRSNILLAVACLVLASLHTVYAASSAGCGKSPTLKSQRYSMTVNGKQRQYFMKIPNNYDNSHPYRLVFTWHQLGGSAQKIVNGENPQQGGALPYYGLEAISNNSAIFVVPDGLNAGWGNQGGEDVTFFDQLVKTVEADLCVDTNLRFSTGFSYGGAMSYALACARLHDPRRRRHLGRAAERVPGRQRPGRVLRPARHVGLGAQRADGPAAAGPVRGQQRVPAAGFGAPAQRRQLGPDQVHRLQGGLPRHLGHSQWGP